MAVERVSPFGLKEVADVYFFPAGCSIDISATYNTTYYGGYISAGPTAPLFIFDTLKVSNIEVSSEDTSATGGKGNPELISWSYGKEITFTMEDAVFSMATLDLMFGANASVDDSDTPAKITIDSDTFPANYCIVGLTYMRKQVDGKDYPFVFEIPNAKVQVGGTLTMEADGDPTTFEMTIKALKKGQGDDKNALVIFHPVNEAVSGSTHTSDNVKTTS